MYFPIILLKPLLHQKLSGIAAALKIPSAATVITAIKVLSNMIKGIIILVYIIFMIILGVSDITISGIFFYFFFFLH